MNSLHVEAMPDDAARVVISGEFSEHSDFSPVLALASPALVFDLRDVHRINSCGVREWIRLMDALRAAGRSLVFEHCSVPFVNQMNMIVNFNGTARVRSFYVPYLCARCNREYVELCDVPDRGRPVLRESSTCPQCGSLGEFDDLPDSYLAFAH